MARVDRLTRVLIALLSTLLGLTVPTAPSEAVTVDDGAVPALYASAGYYSSVRNSTRGG